MANGTQFDVFQLRGFFGLRDDQKLAVLKGMDANAKAQLLKTLQEAKTDPEKRALLAPAKTGKTPLDEAVRIRNISAPGELTGLPMSPEEEAGIAGTTASGLGLAAGLENPVALIRSILAGTGGAYAGGKTGGYLFGKTGETVGKIGGGLVGSVLGYRGIPGMKFKIGGFPIELGTSLSPEAEAEELVRKQMAVKAARVRLGVDPPTEDTIAQILQDELLGTPKKSPVPQEIPLPKGRTPTYIPEGIPGAKPTATPKTIGDIARERVATATRKAGDRMLQDQAEKELGVKLPEAEFSKLSEGPTALQHQVARQNALEDIRNATINRPGWLARLPVKALFKKMSPEMQKRAIQLAIATDDEAVAAISRAVREGARTGSAGDLASWTQDSLWQRYMQEVVNPSDSKFKQVLADEISRRGLARTNPGQVRP